MRDTLGARLNRIRADRGMNQVEVAEATGLGRSFLSMLENDKKEPGLANLLALADFYDVSVDYLVCRSPSPARHAVLDPDKPSQVIDDPDELAIISLWREMNQEQRGAMLVGMRALIKHHAA